MKRFRYYMLSAFLAFGVTDYPLADIKRIGFNIAKHEPMTIDGYFVFWCDNVPDMIPSYILEDV